MQELNRELTFYKKGIEQEEIELEEMMKFMNRLNRIMRKDLREWLKIHEEASEADESTLGQKESQTENIYGAKN